MKYYLLAAAASLFGPSAMAADFTNIVIERPVNASADNTWKKVGPYCSLTEWLGAPCEITNGNGVDLGSIRSIAGGRVTEIIVARTKYSYTYTFPPPNPDAYHGTLEVVPEGPKKSKIVYTLFYKQPEADAKEDKERRTKTFTAGVEKMVKMAEGK